MTIQDESNELTNHIIHYIFSGEFKPGDRLPSERDMCKILHASRPKIREVIQTLSYVGYLKTIRGSGTYLVKNNELMVKSVSASNLILEFERKKLGEIWQVRYILEKAAAGIAAETATEEDLSTLRESFQKFESIVENNGAPEEIVSATLEFHNNIIRATHNVVLQQIIENMYDLLKFTRERTQTVSDSSMRAVGFHRKLMEAICSKDKNIAETAMHEHLLDVRNDINQYLTHVKDKKSLLE